MAPRGRRARDIACRTPRRRPPAGPRRNRGSRDGGSWSGASRSALRLACDSSLGSSRCLLRNGGNFIIPLLLSLPMRGAMTLWTRAGLGWRELAIRLWGQVYEDELLARCAELAYFFLFSIFPLLLFLTTLLGYIAGTNEGLRLDLFRFIARVSPSLEVTTLVHITLDEITTARTGTKLWLSLVAALWVA